MGFSESFCAGDQIDGDRPYQEDYFRFKHIPSDSETRNVLLVLADGMGGHAGGAEASRAAVSGFIDHYEETRGDDVVARLRECLDAANQAVERRAVEDASLTGMGCTLVGCLIAGDDARWVSVGDSPLWLLADGELTRLNEDHSLRPYLEALVAEGRMTPEELENDYRVHQLRSAVMGEELELVDCSQEPVRLLPGQKLILASDGLETVPETEIASICAGRENPDEAVSALLAAVAQKARPHQDNATVMVYQHLDFSDFAQTLAQSEEAPTLVRQHG